jgi:hypothetical protein
LVYQIFQVIVREVPATEDQVYLRESFFDRRAIDEFKSLVAERE